ncbi:hypothetical protein B0H14DRAFT_3457852 [Mycena olivaceomarginata]|nr:hypothetical protein B0H14DRAFT_3457852 [Mycena olivaceomarginata]
MSSTRHTLPEQTIKVEESFPQLNNSESLRSDPNIPQKHAREDFDAKDVLETTISSGQVKSEEVLDESEQLQSILREAILMKDAIIKQNQSLTSELRRMRCELHRMWTMMGSAGWQLQVEAAQRFRGIDIDSDIVSEDELEDISE